MRAAVEFMKEHFSGQEGLRGAEIGVERGTHSAQLLAVLSVAEYHAIDIWEPFVQAGKSIWNPQITESNLVHAQKALEPFSGVHIVKGASLDAVKDIADGYLDFVYIDANHQYDSVLEDIHAWYPKVRVGGVISGHDFCYVWPGVRRAVIECLDDLGLTLYHGHTPEEGWDDWWTVKVEDK